MAEDYDGPSDEEQSLAAVYWEEKGAAFDDINEEADEDEWDDGE